MGTGGPDPSWKITSSFYGFLRNSGTDPLEKQLNPLSPTAFRRGSLQPPYEIQKKKKKGSAHVLSPDFQNYLLSLENQCGSRSAGF